MRILALLPSYRPCGHFGKIGGGEISNRILLEGLAASGHSVTVLSFSVGEAYERTSNGVRIIGMPGSRVARSVDWFLKRILYRRHAQRLIWQVAPDALIATTDSVAVGVTLGERYRIPTSVFIRAFENLNPTSNNGRRPNIQSRRLVKRALLGECGPDSLKKADLLLPNSQFMAGVCHERVPDVATAVVYPPLDFHVCEPPDHYAPTVVSMVGTSEKKGTTLVSRVAAQLPDMQFRVVGSPELAVGEIAKVGNFMRTGWCDTQTEFRERADIVIVPSLWQEPFGRVAIEALAAGKIPLVSDVGGLPETVGYRRDLIVPAGDASAWVSRLRNVMENPDKYRSAAASARASLWRFQRDVQVSSLERMLLKSVGRQ